MAPTFLFFSGGTALNAIESIFKLFTDSVYVLPISDNGGSSSVIMDVIGGPSIGDIRSRICRLADNSTPEARAVGALLMYRLPLDSSEGKREWLAIVEGTHDLWQDISEPYKETIRAFLIHFNTETLRQANKKQFTFSNGSVGNFFLTGARIFFNSLETSLFWFSRVVRIPSDSSVLPIVNINTTIHIGVELENGKIIHGQHEISHPTATPSLPSPRFHQNPLIPSPRHNNHHSYPDTPPSHQSVIPRFMRQLAPSHLFSGSPQQQHQQHPPPSALYSSPQQQLSPPSANSQTSPQPILLPPSQRRNSYRNLIVNKGENSPLEAKIQRLFYLNEDRQEILPPCNPSVLLKIREQDTIVYSIGSLWTSIIPCLVLKGIGEEISHKKGNKILILNGYPDRETHEVTGVDYVILITNALNRWGTLSRTPHHYVTHLLWVEGSTVRVDEDALRAHGIACVRVARAHDCDLDAPLYDESDLVQHLSRLGSCSNGHETNGS